MITEQEREALRKLEARHEAKMAAMLEAMKEQAQQRKTAQDTPLWDLVEGKPGCVHCA